MQGAILELLSIKPLASHFLLLAQEYVYHRATLPIVEQHIKEDTKNYCHDKEHDACTKVN